MARLLVRRAGRRERLARRRALRGSTRAGTSTGRIPATRASPTQLAWRTARECAAGARVAARPRHSGGRRSSRYGYAGDVLLAAQARAPRGPGTSVARARRSCWSATRRAFRRPCARRRAFRWPDPSERAARARAVRGARRTRCRVRPAHRRERARCSRRGRARAARGGATPLAATRPGAALRRRPLRRAFAAPSAPLFACEPAPWIVHAELGRAPRAAPSGDRRRGASRCRRSDPEPPRARAACSALRAPAGCGRGRSEIHAAAARLPPRRPRRPPRRRAGALCAVLVLGLLGGLVLNLMPCVLPVLALKVVAARGARRQRSRREALATRASPTPRASSSRPARARAVACVALRAAGTRGRLGLPAPGAALRRRDLLRCSSPSRSNLFGVFEIELRRRRALGGVGAERARRARAASSTGLLAVALATPCSAPFLGTAVGFAFASPAPIDRRDLPRDRRSASRAVRARRRCSPALGAPRCRARARGWLDSARGPRLRAAADGRVAALDPRPQRGRRRDRAALLAAAGRGRSRRLDSSGVAQRRRALCRLGARARCSAAIAAPGARARSSGSQRGPPRAAEAPAMRRARVRAPRTLDARALAARPPGVRLLHRRLVPDLQAERAARARHRRRRGRAARARLRRASAATGRGATRRSARELARLGKAGVPVYACIPPAAPDSPALLPELLDAWTCCSSRR